MTQTIADGICGLILAGGQGSRMGGIDKAFVPLAGKPLIAHVAERARPQVGALLISANGDVARFAPFGAHVLADEAAFGSAGPLSGIFTALRYLQSGKPGIGWLALFACDTPFFPKTLIARLRAEALRAKAAVALPMSGGRVHPVFALLRADIAVDASDLQNLGTRKAESWMTRFPHVRVEFSENPIDPFFNLNRPEDVTTAKFLRAARNG